MTILVQPIPRRRTRRPRPCPRPQAGVPPPKTWPWVVLAEAVGAAIGFVSLVWQARRLGPEGFAQVEWAGAVAAWMLVVVRGGFDVIVYREAARRPRLIRPLTELLVGLRLLAAVAGYGLVLMLAATLAPEKGAIVAVAGLGLFATAFAVDVAPRAQGRLGWIAGAQATRALGGAAAVLALVRGPGDVLAAAACLAMTEVCAAIVPFALHLREYSWPRPRIRRRATQVLATRGVISGLSRLGRVTLYGADLLVLGAWAGADFGLYAAGRRMVFALLAMGIVIPSALGPSISASWALGVAPARRHISAALVGLWTASLPAALGLAWTAQRWMPLLFGEAYRDGGPWLALIAARLPLMLASAFAPAALTACRREDWALRLVGIQCGLALVALPIATWHAGAWGAGWAAFWIEAVGAVVGWAWMKELGVAPTWTEQLGRPLIGCLGLCALVTATRDAPLVAVVAAGILGYAAAWRCAGRFGLELHT